MSNKLKKKTKNPLFQNTKIDLFSWISLDIGLVD
jgi:hypothetical protein